MQLSANMQLYVAIRQMLRQNDFKPSVQRTISGKDKLFLYNSMHNRKANCTLWISDNRYEDNTLSVWLFKAGRGVRRVRGSDGVKRYELCNYKLCDGNGKPSKHFKLCKGKGELRVRINSMQGFKAIANKFFEIELK